MRVDRMQLYQRSSHMALDSTLPRPNVRDVVNNLGLIPLGATVDDFRMLIEGFEDTLFRAGRNSLTTECFLPCPTICIQ